MSTNTYLEPSASVIELDGYLCGAAAVAVIYDHMTTLDLEFEHMWKKWTFLEFLFISNRYIGTINAIFYFLPPSLETKILCGIKLDYRNWAICYIVWTMQGITQYRIYVMYRNSRKVLIFMASGFAVEVICMTVGTAIITQQLGPLKAHLFSETGPVLCAPITERPKWAYAIYIPTIWYECILFGLALSAGILYYSRRTDQYHIPGSTSLVFVLLRDSILFPLITVVACLAYTILVWHSSSSTVAIGVSRLLPGTICRILGSRLVLNLREVFYLPFMEEMELAASEYDE